MFKQDIVPRLNSIKSINKNNISLIILPTSTKCTLPHHVNYYCLSTLLFDPKTILCTLVVIIIMKIRNNNNDRS